MNASLNNFSLFECTIQQLVNLITQIVIKFFLVESGFNFNFCFAAVFFAFFADPTVTP